MPQNDNNQAPDQTPPRPPIADYADKVKSIAMIITNNGW